MKKVISLLLLMLLCITHSMVVLAYTDDRELRWEEYYDVVTPTLDDLGYSYTLIEESDTGNTIEVSATLTELSELFNIPLVIAYNEAYNELCDAEEVGFGGSVIDTLEDSVESALYRIYLEYGVTDLDDVVTVTVFTLDTEQGVRTTNILCIITVIIICVGFLLGLLINLSGGCVSKL